MATSTNRMPPRQRENARNVYDQQRQREAANGRATNSTNGRGAGRGRDAAANAGTFLGNAAGAMAGAALPPMSFTFINAKDNKFSPTGGKKAKFTLPDPEFDSPAAIKDYCNSVRTLAVGLGIEAGMAKEILQAKLKQLPDEDGKVNHKSKMRARRVAWQFFLVEKAFRAAAKAAVSTATRFETEYEPMLSKFRVNAKQQTPRMHWGNQ